MRLFLPLIALICLLVPSLASAYSVNSDDIKVYSRGDTSGIRARLCDAETDTGQICNDASSVDYAAGIQGYSRFAVYGSAASGAWSCSIYVDFEQNVASSDTDLSDNGWLVGTVSSTSDPLVYANAVFGLVWANCTVPGAALTLDVEAWN